MKQEQQPQGRLGFWGRRKVAWEAYKTTRKEMMRKQRDYFASDEIDESRQKEVENRNQEFIRDLKKGGIKIGIFLMIYLVMRWILGL